MPGVLGLRPDALPGPVASLLPFLPLAGTAVRQEPHRLGGHAHCWWPQGMEAAAGAAALRAARQALAEALVLAVEGQGRGSSVARSRALFSQGGPEGPGPRGSGVGQGSRASLAGHSSVASGGPSRALSGGLPGRSGVPEPLGPQVGSLPLPPLAEEGQAPRPPPGLQQVAQAQRTHDLLLEALHGLLQRQEYVQVRE